MRAIILAGGYGSRLQPLTLRIPKAQVSVAGEPVLAHLLHMVESANVSKVVVSLNKNQESIEEAFGDGSEFGVDMEYHYEHSESDLDKPGAVGALYQLVQELGPEESFVIGGDNTVYGLDLDRMLTYHRQKQAAATLALYELANPRLVEQYGVTKTDTEGRIVAFQEKPSVKEALSRQASTAVYILSESFLRKSLPEFVQWAKDKAGKADRIGDLWHHFYQNLPLYGFAFSGVWGDTNSVESYLDTHMRVMEHRQIGTVVDPSATVDPAARLVPPVILGSGCQVAAGATVGPFSVLGPGVRVDAGATVIRSILYDGVQVGVKAWVEDSILDQGVQLGENGRVEKQCMLGEGVRLEGGARVLAGSKIWPHASLSSDAVVRGCLKFE
ncbi:NDP-sugar synthase [Candidatus Micrarchaeota archaeon]|nr:NDP-sugar synthase [Candidatus Micrarchaeota archaeon]